MINENTDELVKFVIEVARITTRIHKLVRYGGPWRDDVYRRAGACLADLKLLEQSLAEGGAARRCYLMGMVRAQQGTPREAIADFRKALELDPDGFWGRKARQELEALESRESET